MTLSRPSWRSVIIPCSTATLPMTIDEACSTVSFSIGNAYTLFNAWPSGIVFDDLGANSGSPSSNCTSQSAAIQDSSCAFDFGFPFFLGRHVYIAFAGASTAWGTGPYFAY